MAAAAVAAVPCRFSRNSAVLTAAAGVVAIALLPLALGLARLLARAAPHAVAAAAKHPAAGGVLIWKAFLERGWGLLGTTGKAMPLPPTRGGENDRRRVRAMVCDLVLLLGFAVGRTVLIVRIHGTKHHC